MRPPDTRAAPAPAERRIATPLGPLTLRATPRGLSAVLFDGQKHHPGPLASAPAADPAAAAHAHLAHAADELSAYFAGTLRAFAVPLDPAGTAFQQAVWQALRVIPFGGLDHYGALAARLGRPQAARAVGAAVGRNPLAIVVPCHRVVGRSGALTGFAAGLLTKQALLALEAGEPPAPPRRPVASAAPAGPAAAAPGAPG